ncbi:MAG: VCBS repeat-containing protein [Flavobacteriales bacterium]|nr:VCBS repeat-containing protein [Flavobacteriales bacterium]
MKGRTTLWAIASLLSPLALNAQLSFTNASNQMTTTYSGGCMGVVDMNGDGLDDIVKLDNARLLVVEYQNTDGSFTPVNYGNMSNSGQWGFAVADIDNNGHKDVVSGGSYDGVHYRNISSVGNSTIVDLNNGSLFTQCVNIADIDNDGHNDYWSCHDDGAPRQWLNDGNGNLAYANIIDYTTNPTSDMSGNYGSVWTDFDNDGDLDLYIAHCRQGVNDPADPRRWNRLFVNDGSNNYTDQAAAYGIQIRNQSWTADFGDIDNDGDFDMVVTNHDATIQLFENDGAGHFTEITSGSGLEYTGFMLQSKFADFDNDGFVDILIAGGVEYYFHNDGDHTFTRVNGMFPANKAMHSFATGDLNNDGFVDVFANYGSNYITADNANPDRLWMNDANDNHWFGVRLKGTVSNLDAVGARITITGPWGTQIREVRAGESYGMVTTFAGLFGLGQHTTIPTLTVNWPSGLEDTYTDLSADQYVTLIEGTCISPEAMISPVGDPVLCGGGDQVELSANVGFTYTWSTGATTQNITVGTAGSYSVTIDDGNGCTATASYFVQESPDETPTVETSGALTFCEGGSVTLTSSAAASYMWTGGATSQSIEVTAAGSYAVTIEGTCAEFTSAVITVDVLAAAAPPVADDVNILVPGTADLTATGDNITWYDVASGGTPVGTGNTFTTPFVSSNTVFYATAATVHGGEVSYGGPQDRLNTASPGQYHINADNYPFFTAYEPFTIVSVKVYANGAGSRTVQLTDRTDGSVLASFTADVPDGESRITLNFDVPAAGDYGLRIASGNPQLWRDGLGSNPAYPFALGTVGAITSSSVAGANATAYYYFFYDWEVATPSMLCESERTPVEVTIGTVGVEESHADGLRVYPNPASGFLTIDAGSLTGITAIDLLDVTGRIARSLGASASGVSMVDLQGLSAGQYTVRVRHASGRSLTQVIVR